jgi:hypothetical protein
VSSNTRFVEEPQLVSDNNEAASIKQRWLIAAHRTNKFHQRMSVADQGKKCRDDNDRKKCSFAEKIVACLVFEIVAGNVPKRARRGPATICAETLKCDRMVVVIGNRRHVMPVHCGIKGVAAAGVTGCYYCWFHGFRCLLFPVRCASHPNWIQNLLPPENLFATARLPAESTLPVRKDGVALGETFDACVATGVAILSEALDETAVVRRF